VRRIVDGGQVLLYIALLKETANQRSMSADEVTADYYVSQSGEPCAPTPAEFAQLRTET
jgi:hypothetical protein